MAKALEMVVSRAFLGSIIYPIIKYITTAASVLVSPTSASYAMSFIRSEILRYTAPLIIVLTVSARSPDEPPRFLVV